MTRWKSWEISIRNQKSRTPNYEIPMKKYILTNQRKNEYFQENDKKSIEITREMILFDDPNESIERKSNT